MIRRRRILYTVGAIGTILQLLKLPDGTVKVLVEGGERASVVDSRIMRTIFEATAEMCCPKTIRIESETEA